MTANAQIYCIPRQSDKIRTCPPCGASAGSGGGFGGQTLEKQQVELRRLTDQAGQDRMDLAAVMGLVVEPMRQRRRQFLLDFLR